MDSGHRQVFFDFFDELLRFCRLSFTISERRAPFHSYVAMLPAMAF